MKFKSIWVLGSTSETAISICIELANKGCNKFHLISRNYTDNEFLVRSLKNIEVLKLPLKR